MERQPYRFNELFSGNWELFQKVLQNPETVFVYDNDGIFSDTSKEVYKRFSQKYGVPVKTSDIDGWTYLTNVARSAGLSEDDIRHAEDDFYNPDVLEKSQNILYIRPVIQKTISYYGAKNNFILTSRDSEFKDVTLDWFERKFKGFLPENILIRDEKEEITGEEFKILNLKKLALRAPWVVFVDDALKFVKAALDADIENCLVVNIPQGKVMPDFRHEHLVVIKRFPEDIQAVYPLMDALDRALNCTKPYLTCR